MNPPRGSRSHAILEAQKRAKEMEHSPYQVHPPSSTRESIEDLAKRFHLKYFEGKVG